MNTTQAYPPLHGMPGLARGLGNDVFARKCFHMHDPKNLQFDLHISPHGAVR